MGPLDKAFVSLTQGQLHVDQSLDMPIFQIMDWKLLKEMNSNRRTTLKMTMVLKRTVTNELMTTYFPTLLLTAITFAITFFKPFFFEAALSVNLTTMLVMTTILMSKMESLPPTSDIKMIDIWLVLCQMVPFAEVVLLTAMEYNRVDSLDGSERGIIVAPPLELEEKKREDQIPYIPRSGLPQLKIIGECFEISRVISYMSFQRGKCCRPQC